MASERQFTAHQKAGQVAIWLSQGSQLTTRDVARLTGMTFMGAKYMLEMLSLVLPIVHLNHKWQWVRRE